MNENDNSLSSINDSNLSENQSLNYILKRNEALDSENKLLRNNIEELKIKLSEEEDINDRNDSRLSHMKGLTKNVVEAKVICETIKDNSKLAHSKYKKIIEETVKKFESDTKHFTNFTIGYNLLLIIFIYIESYLLFFTFISIVTIDLVLLNNYKINSDLILEKNITKYKREIENIKNKILKEEVDLNKLKSATDFLHDHIDGI